MFVAALPTGPTITWRRYRDNRQSSIRLALVATAGRRRLRDRHGRGARGPIIGPITSPAKGLGPTAQPGLRLPTERERFDAQVVSSVTQIEAQIEKRWHDRLGLVEYAVEDAPLVPDDWDGQQVPLSALIRGSGTSPTRLVIFRRPIEHRSESREEVAAVVHLVLIEQLAELLGTTPEQIDPRYERD